MCVLVSAWERGNSAGQKKPCDDLTRRIVACSNHRLALDKKTRIRTQYERMCPEDSRRWLTQLASQDKIVSRDPVPLNQSAEEKLRKSGFGSGGTGYQEDIKYVEVARATTCRILVSHESHFQKKHIKDILKAKRIGIKVKVRSPQEALALPCSR
jgi:hypothetical protein